MRREPIASLADVVFVRQSGTRSINVEQDLRQRSISESYILTVQARRSLDRLFRRAQGERPQRAWTLTGPYGSGKSYFGLFMMNLLCSESLAHADAREKLATIDPTLVLNGSELAKLDHTKGLLTIPIVGHRISVQECLRQGILRAASSLSDNAEVTQLAEVLAAWDSMEPSHYLIEVIHRLVDLVTAPEIGYGGILLVLDEMGKPLEYAAAHPNKSDIYLLQEIAEAANRSGDKPILFVGMLHQSFERYAGYADSLTQKEWAKIQGRYEDIAFQEPPTQQMRLLANAIDYTDKSRLPEAWSTTVIEEAIAEGLTPALLQESEFRRICRQAAPFHPTALTALPYLFQRLAQNERSIFAYLTSSEPLGFQTHLQDANSIRQVRLSDLFNYITTNFQGRIYAALRSRSLTEALEKLNNTPNLSPLAADLLKTIGLLNWLAEIGPFDASKQKILFTLRSVEYTDTEITATLDKLEKRSIVVFRRFNQSYAIWQGSDVDVEERIEEARQQLLSTFSTAQAVQHYLPPQPAMARRHSYRTGTTRFFDVRYVDMVSKDHLDLHIADGASGIALLCLSESSVEADAWIQWMYGEELHARQEVVIGILPHTPRLAELLKEMHCLHWVRDNTPELRDDPVARKELRTRLANLETLIRNELDQTVRLHRSATENGLRWFYLGEEVTLPANRGISQLISFVCDQLYEHTPIVRNEILNRRQLSSQGAAARRNLVEALLYRTEVFNLGIEGYPPERSMYESLIKAGGLHRENSPDNWGLNSPPDLDPLRLRPIWQAMTDYIFGVPPETRGVQDLYSLLQAPPYGLTEGVLPVLLYCFLRIHQDETTLYYEGTLTPEPGIADWEVLLRRPELFSIAGCRIVGPRKAIIERLARGLGTQPAAMPVVRDLVRRLRSLPEHVWRTQRLSSVTLEVRQVIDRARSPESLLFHQLPMALGLVPFKEGDTVDNSQIEDFFAALNATLQEFNDAMPNLLAQSRDRLLAACELPPGEDGWQQFLALATELAPKVQQPLLMPLLRRASDTPDPASALESALAYVANRPPRSWSDHDRVRFEQQVDSIGQIFRRERNGHNPEAGLSEAQRQRSRSLAEEIRGRLHDFSATDDPAVIRAALNRLLHEYREQPQTEHRNGSHS